MKLLGIFLFVLLLPTTTYGMLIVKDIISHKVYYDDGRIVHELKNNAEYELKNITITDKLDGRSFVLVIDRLEPGSTAVKGYDAVWLKKNSSVTVETQVVYYLGADRHVTLPERLNVFVPPAADYRVLIICLLVLMGIILFLR